MSKRCINLTDIYDLQRLEEFHQGFAEALDVASTIVDLYGNPIVQPANHSRICQIIRSTEKGLENCMRSAREHGEIARKTRAPYSAPCKSIGFIDATAPIIVNEEHIANILIGQACLGDVDEGRVIEYASEIHADKDSMLDAYRSMTNMPQQEFEKKVQFLWNLSNQMSRQAYNNLLLERNIKELRQSKKELEDYKLYLEDIVERRTKQLQDALTHVREISITDRLTGCYNREYLEETLPREFQRCNRYGHDLSLVMCDIDNFKDINDKYGHRAGDSILRDFGYKLSDSVRKDIDWVARYGGEEFLVVLPETSKDSAAILAERLRESIEKTFFTYEGNTIRLTASFGIASIKDENIRISSSAYNDFIEIADRNLYKAKHFGKNMIYMDNFDNNIK